MSEWMSDQIVVSEWLSELMIEVEWVNGELIERVTEQVFEWRNECVSEQMNK